MSQETETVEQVCELIRRAARVQNADDPRAVIALANRILATHKREILVEINLASDHIIGLQDQIASLKLLVKKLADALKKVDDMCDGDMCKFFTSTKHCSKCKYLGQCQTGIAHNVLKTNESEIAKALEVVSEMETTTEACK